jgi:hypothetical protein
MVNLVVAVEKGVADSTVEKGAEIFIFRDNYVTVCAFYRGTSKSPGRFGSASTRFRDILLKIIWLTGRHPIAQGADGLS